MAKVKSTDMFRQIMILTLSISLLVAMTVSKTNSLYAQTAAQPTVISVWPGLAPGEQKTGTGDTSSLGSITIVTNIFTPRLFIYSPLNLNKRTPAILIFPGGGYGRLAQDLEGSEIATWLNSLGYVAVILDYRVPNNRHGALQDAQRSIALLRSRSKSLSIDPNRIGVIGFSAGGHLAAALSTSYTQPAYAPIDKVDSFSIRPDFAMLIYPAYLIGDDKHPAPEVAPHPGMPPFFLIQAKDDPFLCAPAYAQALKNVGVSESLLTYDTAGHGYGLRLPETSEAHDWSHWAAIWLKATLSE